MELNRKNAPIERLRVPTADPRTFSLVIFVGFRPYRAGVVFNTKSASPRGALGETDGLPHFELSDRIS
jgi:hypothetical protein